jgi:serine/threonine-protein kinase
MLALQEAHGCGLVHRDIKPANILIQDGSDPSAIKRESVKVTDFGLGRTLGLTTASIMQSGSMLTEQGKSISGTLAYMSPEQLEGGPVDARSDICSAGIVLFEMLTGSRPQGRELPSQVRKDVPKWLDEVFARCYTRRESRYESSEQVLAAMNREPPSTAQPGRPAPAKPEVARRLLTNCPECQRQVEPGDNFCIWCGHKLAANPRKCPQCGGYPEPYDRFCVFCGASLTRLE